MKALATAFLKALVIVAAVSAVLVALHIVLGLLFYGPKVLGLILGLTLGWLTYRLYLFERDRYQGWSTDSQGDRF